MTELSFERWLLDAGYRPSTARKSAQSVRSAQQHFDKTGKLPSRMNAQTMLALGKFLLFLPDHPLSRACAGTVDPCELAMSFGATWVGRGFSGDPKTLVDLMVGAIEHHGFAFLNVLSPCVTWRGDDQFKILRAKVRQLPEDHDRTSRQAALRYTREKETLTTGVLYEVAEPSLLDRMADVQRKAQKAGPVTGIEEVLAAFAPAS